MEIDASVARAPVTLRVTEARSGLPTSKCHLFRWYSAKRYSYAGRRPVLV